MLVLLSAVLMIPLAFAIAMISAHYRRRRPDTVIQTILLAMAGLPEFVIGVLLIALLATTVLKIFPAVTITSPTGHPWDNPDAMVLPTLTLVLWVAPYVSRIVRASLLEVIDSEYVELARLKGVPESIVMRSMPCSNAIVPGIQVVALQLAFLAGGVVVVETLFSYPGVRPPARRRRAQPRRAGRAGAQHDHRQRLRRGEPDRRLVVHPVDPAREDGDLLMSTEAAPPPPRSPPRSRRRSARRCGRSGSRSASRSPCCWWPSS